MPKGGHFPFQYGYHLLGGLMLNSCQSLEVFVTSGFDFFVSHVPIMAHLPLLQEVYLWSNGKEWFSNLMSRFF